MSNWEEKYLTDFANLNYGDNLPSSLLKPFGFKVFGANGYIGFNDTFNVNRKTVLISCRGEYSGTINIVPEKTFVTNNSILVNLKTEDVDTQFIFYKLQRINKALIVSGSAQPQVTIIDLKRVTLQLPKQQEQQHIARILSTADAVIEKTQAAIAKYKAIKQGMLQDLFTRGIDLNTNKLRPRYEDAPELYKESKLGMIPREWAEKELGDVGEVRMCRRIFNYETNDQGDIPFYKIGTFGKQPDAYISKELYDSYRQQFSFPKKGDILISAAGTIVEPLFTMELHHIFKIQILFGLKIMVI